MRQLECADFTMSSTGARRKTMAPNSFRPLSSTDKKPSTPKAKLNANDSSSTNKVAARRAPTSSRKASTPTHDKTAQAASPDVSHILPADTTALTSKRTTSTKPLSNASSKTNLCSDGELSLTDQLDFEYTRHLQTMFARKLAEAETSNNRLALLQKRIAGDQDLLQKTTERLKNINFNKEVEILHKLKNTHYGQVLETLNGANCKEYLETVNQKLEQSQNQLKLKNIEPPQGGTSELFDVLKDTLAACEKLKANNNVEVPKILADIRENNNSTVKTISSCLEMVPQVESLMLDKLVLETVTKDDISQSMNGS